MREVECTITYVSGESGHSNERRQISYMIQIDEQASEMAIENQIMADGVGAILGREGNVPFEVVDVRALGLIPPP